jgi:hypothetical protein
VNPDDTDAAQAEEAPRKSGEVFYTDAGRVVYAAGGITPDVMAKNDARDSKLLAQLLARGLTFSFAVDWTSRHPDVTPAFEVTPAVREAFFQFCEAQKFSTAEELQRQWNEDPNKGLVDLAVRVDMVNVKYGLEAGWKARSAGDTQIQQALGLFGEAARVAALPKKANTARASKGN